MAFQWADNVHTTIFTPRDYQVELLASAFEQNTIICLGHKSSKEFIALKLLQELSRQSEGVEKSCIYLTCGGAQSMKLMLQQLTDITVYDVYGNENENTEGLPKDYQVYIMHPVKCLMHLRSGKLSINNVHLLILEDCHEEVVHSEILPIFKEFIQNDITKMPKVLALAGPIHNANCLLEELSAMLETIEKNLLCKVETASDIVTVLRYCSKPNEYIVQCAPTQTNELSAVIEDILMTRKAFLKDHRYDPYEIYNSSEYVEDLKNIPDPKKEPVDILNIVLSVLYEMGPFATRCVAYILVQRIEKLKIKTPHVRHFVLLSLVSTALNEIFMICEHTFREFTNTKVLIEHYSSPKVLRLLDVLRLFKPEISETDNVNIKRINVELEKMDFQKLTRSLESSCQNIERIEKQKIESQSIIENLDPILKSNSTFNYNNINRNNRNSQSSDTHKSETRSHHHNNNGGHGRSKRRPFIRRQMRDNSDISDTLCSIIFCNTNYTARALFDLITEMSKHDPDLKYLKCQFTCDRVADSVAEPKEADNEHRRQEEVLKRFRMHDCNVLIGTSILEEGMDLPKCNLVVRWDPPTTYRSYVQCKGRARAMTAYHVILVSSKFNVKRSDLHTKDQLSDKSHAFICRLRSDQDDTIDSDSSDECEVASNQFTIGCSKGTVKILNPEVITYQPPTANKTICLEEINEEKDVDEKIDVVVDEEKDVDVDEEKDIDDDEEKDTDESNDDAKTDIHSLFSLNNTNKVKKGISDEIEALSNGFKKLGCIYNNDGLPLKVKDIDNDLDIISIDEALKVLKSPEKHAGILAGQDHMMKEFIISVSQESSPIHRRKIPASNICAEPIDNGTKNLNNSLKVLNEEKSIEDSCDIKDPIEDDKKISKKPKRKFKCCKADLKNDLNTTDLFALQLAEMEIITDEIIDQMAQYREIEKMLLEKCANKEPPESEHILADEFNNCIMEYKPSSEILTGASVDLSTSIALVNKYCSKLPSDTFTKLTALWRSSVTTRFNKKVYQCTIRLPINSPLKYDIVGVPVGSEILARRVAALQACIGLHKSGELDNNLQPIGKEGFKATEPDWENFELEAQDEKIVLENTEPRPGTTKRRQYYYKRIASEFCNCRPTADTPCYLYLLDLTLQCPIPEEQNTRGRKIYPPEDAQQGFGILTLQKIPKVSSFPIFTRSGEVKVSIELAKEQIILTAKQIRSINTFLNYTFTNVLRLQKFLMLFDPDSTDNCIFIVPTIRTENGKVIDWDFLTNIEENATTMPTAVPEDIRNNNTFDANKFKDAVVMPWYRNQDQPQYFYVAEICPSLSPLSCFPGENYNTFKHYYFVKYGLNIQNVQQPLLDVDHTSARLNFLTPRYVNRKGVALPTSSEETKRAKRENLEQKQILVPELCTVHPFPASLWRTAVCLPCILYRINGLLLADEIRKKVSADIGLGQQQISDEHEWPMLDFGWSLSEVLEKSKVNKEQLNDKTMNARTEEKKESTVSKEENIADQNEIKDLEKISNNVEKSANEIVSEGEQNLKDQAFIEIGTWSNDMASEVRSEDSDDEDMEYMCHLPSNVSFCNQKPRYGSPTFWNVKNISKSVCTKPNFTQIVYGSDDSFKTEYTPESSLDSSENDESDDDRIAFNSRNEAETIETEKEIEKRKKKFSIIEAANANERNYQETKNLRIGYNFTEQKKEMEYELKISLVGFTLSMEVFKNDIKNSRMLVSFTDSLFLKKKTNELPTAKNFVNIELCQKMLPFASTTDLLKLLSNNINNKLLLDDIVNINRHYVEEHKDEYFTVYGSGDIFDNFNDNKNLIVTNIEDNGKAIKQIKLDFRNSTDRKENIEEYAVEKANVEKVELKDSDFSFDRQPDIEDHPGPSPSIILQALTMSNANDGINLERLETIGDSFLKYAITTYLYITYENVHEGKLSHLRSKQVANLNLYRLGRRKILGEYMIATKFEPHDNWLPPCYYVPKDLEKALIEANIPPCCWDIIDLPSIKELSSTEICNLIKKAADNFENDMQDENHTDGDDISSSEDNNAEDPCFIPYNLVTQHSIPDKSVADCVEALIGAYLIECGSRGALLFMAWLGIRVLPFTRKKYNPSEKRIPGSTKPDDDNMITVYGEWTPPKSPLLHYQPNANQELEFMLTGFDKFEATLGYKFRDRSYLLQAMTHASYSPNRLTDCYQRLEFLGDAILDYLITRHLYEDPRQHSPGALTDLRSALVNNTIFASLAVRHGFHKYFRHLSPALNEVIDRFVRIQTENGHSISEEYYLLSEEECDDAEDVEVPKALGDVFESIAGAIFLDSNMSLDVVWKVYSNMMQPEIEQFSNSVPKSPIRELLELEPETAKFGKPEKLADGRRVRVTVEVFCKGIFRGIGRNYRIAKCTAAKCALRQLKKKGLISKKD